MCIDVKKSKAQPIYTDLNQELRALGAILTGINFFLDFSYEFLGRNISVESHSYKRIF